MSDTRELIIQEAGKLFLQRNYSGVSIQDISKAVGMTKGALYHHFENKEKVFEAVARDLLSGFRIDYAVLPQDSLRGFFTEMAEQVQVRQRKASGKAKVDYGMNVYSLVWDAIRLLPGFGALLDDIDRRESEAWLRVVQGAIGRGEIRAFSNAADIARLFTAVADGIGIKNALNGQPKASARQILAAWEVLHGSLRA